MNVLPRLSLLATVLALMLVTFGHAAIILDDSASFTSTSDSVGGMFTVTSAQLGGFNANGADKLVLTIGGEGTGNGASDNTVSSVTYGGASMNLAIAGAAGGNRRSSIWYLDDVTTSGDVVITFANAQDGFGLGAYSLTGTLPGFADTDSTTVTDGGTTITTTSSGEFIVAAFARNNFDNGGGAGIVAPLIPLFYTDLGGSSAASGYQFVATPSTVFPTIQRLSNNAGVTVAAAFQAAPVAVVPEPSSLLIWCLGLAALVTLVRGRNARNAKGGRTH